MGGGGGEGRPLKGNVSCSFSCDYQEHLLVCTLGREGEGGRGMEGGMTTQGGVSCSFS